MSENVIIAPERVMLALDSGESGYILVYNGENSEMDREYGTDQTPYDFIIMTDCGVVLGASDPGNTLIDPAKIDAGGPLYAHASTDPEKALASLLNFLMDAAEKHRIYEIHGADNGVDGEGDRLPFNREVREWAYHNEDELSMESSYLENLV